MIDHDSRCPCVDCRRTRNSQARRRYHKANPDAERRGAQDRTPKHGTRSRYVRMRCRCEECTAANREYARQRYAERAQLHANLARGDDLWVLDRSLVQRGKALEQTPGAEAAARLDEIIRLRTQIDRIQRARAAVRTVA